MSLLFIFVVCVSILVVYFEFKSQAKKEEKQKKREGKLVGDSETTIKNGTILHILDAETLYVSVFVIDKVLLEGQKIILRDLENAKINISVEVKSDNKLYKTLLST